MGTSPERYQYPDQEIRNVIYNELRIMEAARVEYEFVNEPEFASFQHFEPYYRNGKRELHGGWAVFSVWTGSDFVEAQDMDIPGSLTVLTLAPD